MNAWYLNYAYYIISTYTLFLHNLGIPTPKWIGFLYVYATIIGKIL